MFFELDMTSHANLGFLFRAMLLAIWLQSIYLVFLQMNLQTEHSNPVGTGSGRWLMQNANFRRLLQDNRSIVRLDWDPKHLGMYVQMFWDEMVSLHEVVGTQGSIGVWIHGVVCLGTAVMRVQYDTTPSALSTLYKCSGQNYLSPVVLYNLLLCFFPFTVSVSTNGSYPLNGQQPQPPFIEPLIRLLQNVFNEYLKRDVRKKA